MKRVGKEFFPSVSDCLSAERVWSVLDKNFFPLGRSRNVGRRDRFILFFLTSYSRDPCIFSSAPCRASSATSLCIRTRTWPRSAEDSRIRGSTGKERKKYQTQGDEKKKKKKRFQKGSSPLGRRQIPEKKYKEKCLHLQKNLYWRFRRPSVFTGGEPLSPWICISTNLIQTFSPFFSFLSPVSALIFYRRLINFCLLASPRLTIMQDSLIQSIKTFRRRKKKNACRNGAIVFLSTIVFGDFQTIIKKLCHFFLLFYREILLQWFSLSLREHFRKTWARHLEQTISFFFFFFFSKFSFAYSIF